MADPHIAVVGGGVAGLTAAYLLQRRHKVTLFEADGRLGGHTHTHEVPSARGGTVPVDTGFTTFNKACYPTLTRLFRELEVSTQAAEVSYSLACDGCGLSYLTGSPVRGLPAHPTGADPDQWAGLADQIRRFNVAAEQILSSEGGEDIPLGELLSAGGYSDYFARHLVLPYVCAMWLITVRDALAFPARHIMSYLDSFGLLQKSTATRWRTVVGGARTYVDQLAKRLLDARIGTAVRTLTRTGRGVALRDAADNVYDFDRVVVAVHADQALRLLANPTPAERDALGAVRYVRNDAVLHTDSSVLAALGNDHGALSYHQRTCVPEPDVPPEINYDINRVQRLDGPVDYALSLNSRAPIDPAAVLARLVYEHPTYTPESVAALRRLPELGRPTVAYAGTYLGWGTHEDACASAVRAAEAVGGLPW